jgi:diketogulonate reductase-like aldo/keto reductase
MHIRQPFSVLSLLSVAVAVDQRVLAPGHSSTLANIPLIGFGTWNLKISSENTTDAVASAIETGYIHIDCAAAYGNQKDVGRGIEKGLGKAGKRREDIWVTSKLWNDQYVSECN